MAVVAILNRRYDAHQVERQQARQEGNGEVLTIVGL